MVTKDPFSSEKPLPSSSSFIDELHESMSGLLQDLFESEQEILTLSEETPFSPSTKKNPCLIHEKHALMQKDLEALQSLCQNLALGLPSSPQDLKESKLLPLQKHLEKSWTNLSTDSDSIKFEANEMQKWIQIALKQVEKSLDLMEKIPTKY